ncbi:hypothetical protein GCM10009677_38730 [Sphaerisporangium rubeum]
MPSIDIGMRPTNPATTNPLTPGMPKSSRYGPTTFPPLSLAPAERLVPDDPDASCAAPASDFPATYMIRDIRY